MALLQSFIGKLACCPPSKMQPWSCLLRTTSKCHPWPGHSDLHARKRCGPKFVTHFTLLSAVFLTSPAGAAWSGWASNTWQTYGPMLKKREWDQSMLASRDFDLFWVRLVGYNAMFQSYNIFSPSLSHRIVSITGGQGTPTSLATPCVGHWSIGLRNQRRMEVMQSPGCKAPPQHRANTLGITEWGYSSSICNVTNFLKISQLSTLRFRFLLQQNTSSSYYV